MVFGYRLALQLGIPKVEGRDGLLQQLTWYDGQRWLEYYELEPWGDERADMRAQATEAVIAKSFGATKASMNSLLPPFYRPGGRKPIGRGASKPRKFTNPEKWKRHKEMYVRALKAGNR